MAWLCKARRLTWDRFARSLGCCVTPSQRSSSAAVNRTRGSNSRTIRYACGRVICGIFFPPFLLQRQQEGTGQETHHEVVVPAGPGTDLVFIHADVALLRLELRLDRPAGRRYPRQGRQFRVRRRIGEVVARLAAIPVLPIDHPEHRAWFAVAALPPPFGPEPIGPHALGPLRYPHLLPGRG